MRMSHVVSPLQRRCTDELTEHVQHRQSRAPLFDEKELSGLIDLKEDPAPIVRNEKIEPRRHEAERFHQTMAALLQVERDIHHFAGVNRALAAPPVETAICRLLDTDRSALAAEKLRPDFESIFHAGLIDAWGGAQQ